MMREVIIKAAEHKGTSVVEVLQNCIIFANEVHKEITGKDVRDDHQIYLEHGKPMIFGKGKNKGLVLEKGRLKVVTISKDGFTLDDILIHDVKDPDDTTHYMLACMSLPEYPVAMGVIRACATTVYESLLFDQIKTAKETSKIKCMDDLLNSGNVFEVK